MRPRERMRPSVGRRMPAMHFSSVVLPEPLWPISPIEEPCSMSKDTSRRAQKSSAFDRVTSSRCFTLDGRSR